MPAQTQRGDAWRGADTAWDILGTLIAGLVAWGGVGLLLDLWLDLRWLFLPIGMVLGMGTAIYLVYVRHGRE
jgi:F0F1-type ATP synthase assembly protein I